MNPTPHAISDLLQKRRERIRSWVTKDSHALVIGPVREVHAALGAMNAILLEIAPSLSRLLANASAEEAQVRIASETQKEQNKEKARQLRIEAQTEEDQEHAQLLQALARNYDLHIDIPCMSEPRLAGVLLTAAKLYRSADQVSRSRDATAIKTLGLKAATTAGKWALKLTPIRHEDLQDLKDAVEALKTLTDPLDDLTAILEAGKLRSGQAEAASSFFERLQEIRELAEGWCRLTLQEPFFALATGGQDIEKALRVRLLRSGQDWTL